MKMAVSLSVCMCVCVYGCMCVCVLPGYVGRIQSVCLSKKKKKGGGELSRIFLLAYKHPGCFPCSDLDRPTVVGHQFFERTGGDSTVIFYPCNICVDGH